MPHLVPNPLPLASGLNAPSNFEVKLILVTGIAGSCFIFISIVIFIIILIVNI